MYIYKISNLYQWSCVFQCVPYTCTYILKVSIIHTAPWGGGCCGTGGQSCNLAGRGTLPIVLGSWNFNQKPIWAMKKGPQGLFRCFFGGWDTAQVYGDYIINHEIRRQVQQPGFNGMCFSWLESERSLIGKMRKFFQTISRFRFRPKIGTSSLYSTVIFLIPSLSSANQQKSTSKNLFVVSKVVHQPINPPSSMS